jgi:hypothetical protein
VITNIWRVRIALSLRIQRQGVRVVASISNDHRRIGGFLFEVRQQGCVDVGGASIAISAARGQVVSRGTDSLKEAGVADVCHDIRTLMQDEVVRHRNQQAVGQGEQSIRAAPVIGDPMHRAVLGTVGGRAGEIESVREIGEEKVATLHQ